METVSPLERISENILLGKFLNGLNEEIRMEVRLLGPITLEQAMKYALRVEEWNRANNSKRMVSVFTKTSSLASSVYSGRSWSIGASDSTSTVQSPKINPASQSVSKNLGERRELSVLLVKDEEDTKSEDGGSDVPTSPVDETPTEAEVVKIVGDPSLVRAHISLKAMIKTLRKVKKWVFQDPKGLPPTRDHVHSIVLKAGGNPPFIVETNASGYGLGAVLMQNQRPLAFYSKLLWVQAQHKSIYEKELMVLIGFDFEIQFKSGVPNKAADALSRPGQTPIDSLEEVLQERDCLLDDLRLNLYTTRNVMKLTTNKKRRDVEFQPGDLGFSKLQPYRQCSLARRPFEKLVARFYGPFTVLERIGQVAYKLELPDSSKIHSIFHVSQLKRYIGDQPANPMDKVRLWEAGNSWDFRYRNPYLNGTLCEQAYLIAYNELLISPSTRDNDDDHFSKEKLGASNITLVTDVDVWEEKLSEADEAGKIALVNFSADWCTPCRDVLPVFRSLAEQYTSLMFLIVDVDELPDLSTSWEIKATPTFFFLKDGCELDKLVGANKEELRRRTEVMANPSTSSRSFVSGSPDKPSSQRRTDEDTKPPNQRETDENATTQEIDKPSSQRTDDKAKVQNVNQPSNQRTTDDKTKMQ
ncbi:hypothetical protein AgCh_037140 [Apium graveolens]